MLDDVVDAVNGYLFTFVVLCLLTPVVLIRPLLMLVAHTDRGTARRRVALGVVAVRGR